MRQGRGRLTLVTALVVASLLAAGGCRTVPGTEGVASSAPDPDSLSTDISGTESVTDPFGPGESTGSLSETDLTGREIGSASPADDPSLIEDQLENVYFDFDQASLTEQARASLTHNAEFLQQYPTLRIRIEGHCDERGTTEYNLALGDRRANTVKEYLSRLGLDPSRFLSVSFGEEHPADPGHGPAAWARNRRAEFHVN